MRFTMIAACFAAFAAGLLPPPARAESPAAASEGTVLAQIAERDAAYRSFWIDRARAALQSTDPRAALLVTLLSKAAVNSKGQPFGAVAPSPELAQARYQQALGLAGEGLQRARQLGHDDPWVQTYLAQICGYPWAQCDASAALNRLAQLDPDNGYAALLALDRAHAMHDLLGQRAALASAARAKRISHYSAETLGAIYTLFAGGVAPVAAGITDHMEPADLHAQTALGVYLALPLKGFSGLSTLCKRTDADPGLRADCVAVARLLSVGDTLVDEAIGLGMLDRLARGTPEAPAARQALIDAHWQRDMFMELKHSIYEHPGSMQVYISDWIAAGGERALVAQTLSAAGVSKRSPTDYAAPAHLRR